MKKIYPKCLSENNEFGHTARGYILPCCWADRPDLFQSDMKDLVKEKFKLSNIEKIEDIIESKEWTNFYTNLKNNKGYSICYIYCSKNKIKELI
tara:strand:- start:184 stop:465 length:282 start_codon:yes stop_codon:yes gene_type:complete